MTITYPRDPHPLIQRVPRLRFDYEPFGAMSRSAGGAIAFQEKAGGSLWELALTTIPLDRREYDGLHAWVLSLKGGRTFKAWDFQRCFPLAYGLGALDLTRHSGGAFDGTCNVTAAGGATIALGNLPSTYKVTAGDYVSFDWLAGRALVKALEDATAVNGVITGLTVGPWLLGGGTVPVTATLVRAWALFKLKPGSFSADRNGHDATGIEAIQHTGTV